MFRFSLIPAAVLSVFLTACATHQAPQSYEEVLAPVPKLNVEQLELPRVALQPIVLYGIIMSEVAMQRGGVAGAAATYLSLAQLTGDPRLTHRALELAMQIGNFSISEAALELWDEQVPNSMEARSYRLLSTWRKSNLSEAVPETELFLKEADATMRAEFFLHLAPLLAKLGDREAVGRAIFALTEPFVREKEVHFLRAVVANLLNNQEKLALELSNLAQIAPKWDVPVLWRLSSLLKQNESPEQVLTYIQMELKRRPNASVMLKIAYPKTLISLHEYEKARIAFKDILKNEPNHLEANYIFGILSFREKYYSDAEIALQKALKGGYSDSNLVRFTLGQLFEEKKQYKQARNWYESIQKSDHYQRAQLRLAYLDAYEGKAKEGLKRIESVILDNDELSNPIQAILFQTQFAREIHAYDDAYFILTEGIKKYSKEPLLYFERALIAERLNKLRQSEKDLRIYLKLKPRDSKGCNALGYLFADNNIRLSEAKKLIECALSSEPNNAMYLDSYGWLFFRLNQFKKAELYLEKAYQLYPDPEIAAHLGELYFQLGKIDKAHQVWAEALEKKPNHEVLNFTLHRLKQNILELKSLNYKEDQ